jgi:hypothetical protein
MQARAFQHGAGDDCRGGEQDSNDAEDIHGLSVNSLDWLRVSRATR